MEQLSDEELKGKTKEFKKRLKRERHWMIFFRRHLQLYVRRQDVYLEWSITVYRSSVVLFFIRDVSLR